MEKLVFSLGKFKMSNIHGEIKWYDVGELEVLNISAEIIPLFTFTHDLHHDLWDEMMFISPIIIFGIHEHRGNTLTELARYQSNVADIQDEKISYKIDLEIDLKELIREFHTDGTYSLVFSYILDEKEDLGAIVENIFFKTHLPISIDGKWLNGQ